MIAHRRPVGATMSCANVAALVLAAGIAAFPAVVLAQTGASPTPAAGAAPSLVERGLDLRRAGHDADALSLFEQSYAQDHSARTLAQIALAEQALGRWVPASTHMRQALAATSDAWIVHNAPALQSALALIGRHLGTLDILINVPSAEVWINGERIATAPFHEPLQVPVGSALLEIRAAGSLSQRRTVDIEPGLLARESFTLVPAEPGSERVAASTAATSSSGPSPSIREEPTAQHGAGPYVVMAVGAVGLLTGLGLLAGRQIAVGGCMVESDAIHCPTQATYDSAQTAESLNSAMPWAFVIGGVALVGGAAWWVVQRLGGHPDRSVAAAWVAPLPNGVILGGTF